MEQKSLYPHQGTLKSSLKRLQLTLLSVVALFFIATFVVVFAIQIKLSSDREIVKKKPVIKERLRMLAEMKTIGNQEFYTNLRQDLIQEMELIGVDLATDQDHEGICYEVVKNQVCWNFPSSLISIMKAQYAEKKYIFAIKHKIITYKKGLFYSLSLIVLIFLAGFYFLFRSLITRLSHLIIQPMEKLHDQMKGGQRTADFGIREFDELAQAIDEYIDAAKIKTRMTLITDLTHEIKGPINMMAHKLVLLRNTKSADRRQELSLELEKSCDDVLDEVAAVLKKAITKEDEIRYERVFLRDLLPKSIPLKDNPTIICDKALLKNVFNNLYRNAEEAMPAGGRIWTEELLTDQHVEISIFNTCATETDIGKIQKPGFSTKKYGSGVGLDLCRRMLIMHKGELQISKPQKDVFAVTVRLPIA